MEQLPIRRFVSRAGLKLDHALETFALSPEGKTCADLGCNTGGFVDCLLQRGAVRVYALDTGYGVLDWKLRKDARVVVMERTNAMHATLPERVDLITIDVAWTRQRNILPAARRMLSGAAGASIVTLIKPHYEADARQLRKGVLPETDLADVVSRVKLDIAAAGFAVQNEVRSPILGARGNIELLAWLVPAAAPGQLHVPRAGANQSRDRQEAVFSKA